MPKLLVTWAISAYFLDFFAHLSMGTFVVKWFLMMAVLAGVRRIQGRLQEHPPPQRLHLPQPFRCLILPRTSPRTTLRKCTSVHRRTVAVAQDTTWKRSQQAVTMRRTSRRMEDNGGEETVDTTQQRTDEEAEAALTEVCKWIAWKGYV